MQELPWAEPLVFARQFAAHDHFVLLHSSQPDAAGSQQTLLALHPLQIMMPDSWEALNDMINAAPEKLWLGCIPYEMGQGDTAELQCFASYYLFDHLSRKLWLYGETAEKAPLEKTANAMSIATFSSNMGKLEYLAHIRATLEQIHSGEFYQANITRKFSGELAHPIAPFNLFEELAALSPAGYAALWCQKDKVVISSSPESFLQVSAEGKILARPIKGTARRAEEPDADAQIRHSLQQSQKNQAENLMIVDLMRNDLAIHTEPGSVKVEKLFELVEYPHLYHLVSTISAQRNGDTSTVELIRGCFPPGSMTGAPKKCVMEWCAAVEKLPRGIYSGTLGWLAGDGSVDLSVVIRTIILQGKHFEFQVGGGIVADSDPYSEWEETLTKASALFRVLGIGADAIKAI